MEFDNKYIEHKLFQRWIFKSNAKLDDYWERYVREHPMEQKQIEEAKEILSALKTESKEISSGDKVELFNDILKEVDKHNRRRLLPWYVLGYVASFILLIGVAFGGYEYYKSSQTTFFVEQTEIADTIKVTQLQRSSGETIDIETAKSTIEHRPAGKLVVNNHTINKKLAAFPKKMIYNTVVVPFGSISEIFLSDGTRVVLNAGSQLKYPESFDGKTREVLLLGEALFDVSKNANKPFVVRTSDVRVKVLGTVFNVSAYAKDETIQTVLAEGKVEISKAGNNLFEKSLVMKPNEKVTFSKEKKYFRLKEVDANDYIFWVDGLIQCRKTQLQDVIRRLERYYNVEFTYSVEQLKYVRISGKLDMNNSKEEVLYRVSSAAGVKIEELKDGNYTIE
ncbi:DUF4974 domain-containing protein [Prolixibacteraceae bacterium JC049]|nr:DUF4974 domain-containing protein [Prolixibacteraceae bacterium JC049]